MASVAANADRYSSEYALADDAATVTLGAALASVVAAGQVLYLRGDLGAGKTTLTRGLLRGLGFSGRVKSPTYTLVEVYVVSGLNLYHFDFYRMLDPEEWHEAGFGDFFNPTNLCVVEWPEKANGSGVSLPQADLEITLTPTAERGDLPTQRVARIETRSATLASLIQAALKHLPAPS